MQNITSLNCAKNFTLLISAGMAKKGWSLQMLYARANVLSRDDKEVFGYRSLLDYVNGKRLPNIYATVAMDKALELDHKLIKARVEIELEKIEKTPA